DIEGNPYKVTKLEGLCWTENLKSKNYNDGTTPIPFAQSYKNIPQNEIDFGLLYTYESAMAVGVEHALPLQGICPDGWRLPTAAEWKLLQIYDANDLNNTTFWLKPNSYINTTDFDVRGAGFYNSTTGRFEMIYAYAAFWSADAGSTTATAAAIKYHCDEIEIVEITKADALSVRCVMKN
ncbi:MAG: fibrobacter succinogenes major paralogous domain-containing protein, partial [Lentimicrobiaceae bacterium]|nr:fibrobacter succinogenes major paralogous domain-containing protein [Lentimicrobiaceae bacterium]